MWPNIIPFRFRYGFDIKSIKFIFKQKFLLFRSLTLFNFIRIECEKQKLKALPTPRKTCSTKHREHRADFILFFCHRWYRILYGMYMCVYHSCVAVSWRSLLSFYVHWSVFFQFRLLYQTKMFISLLNKWVLVVCRYENVDMLKTA